jgi:hypothetical protein
MPWELYLQRTARECLRNGQLPRMQSQCIWGGYGRGNVCSLCGEPIRTTEVEFEVPEGEEGTPRGLRFHITCHAAWQLECSDEATSAAS